jgi:predicted Zn-dependent protease
MLSRILATGLLTASLTIAADDAIVRAMRDELARSMKKLQLENLDKPYFVAYRTVESSGCSASASFGALIGSFCEPLGTGARNRSMTVEVRVGDYARDNSNFFAPMSTAGVSRIAFGGGVSVPIDDNYDEIRRQLWLATDSAYKTALDTYAKKKAALEHRTRPREDPPDFSREAVVTDTENEPPTAWDKPQVEGMVKALSAIFRETPGIDNSEVRLSATVWHTYYVNSEGTTYTRGKSFVQLETNADTQATDGMPLADFDVVYARSLSELPSRETLSKRVRSLAARLIELRQAQLVDRYSGPVLFEGESAAELFLQAVGTAMVGTPRTVVDDLRFEGMFRNNSGFADKVGARILPDFLTLKDSPVTREFHGMPLFASYQVDDDGVKAGETVLVDKGILQTLLRTRALIPDTTHSTGSRRSTGAMPSNLLFSMERQMTGEQLKAELIRMAAQRHKDYGILVRRIGNPQLQVNMGRSRVIFFNNSNGLGSISVEPVLEAYKVFPDGHEEPVRNLNINGLTLDAFRNILAVSESSTVYTAPVRILNRSPMTGVSFLQPGGPMVVSTNAPSMLFEDITLERPTGDVPIPPFSGHPFFGDSVPHFDR